MVLQSSHSLWVIVLAGGQGSRMCPFVNRCFGHSRPKQYCHFCGPNSMLETTIERALALTDPERLVTVIGKGHRNFLGDTTAGRILEQPEARGTAVGAFWPLTWVLREDREAIVVISPSDHYFYPGEQLIAEMRRAVAVATEHSEEEGPGSGCDGNGIEPIATIPEHSSIADAWLESVPLPDPDAKAIDETVRRMEWAAASRHLKEDIAL